MEAIRVALDAGRYAEAERLASDRAAAAQAANDVSGAAQASDLLVEALTRLGKIGDARTVSLAERLIVDKTTLFGGSSAELVLSLNNLGTLSTARGEFAKSVSLHQRALAIARQLVPLNDAILADTLERLTVPMIWLERFPEAGKTLSEARRIRDQGSESTPSNLAHALYLEALLRRWDGRYNEATTLLDRVSQAPLALAPDHPDNVARFELKGDLLFLKGDVRQAEQTWTETLTLAEQHSVDASGRGSASSSAGNRCAGVRRSRLAKGSCSSRRVQIAPGAGCPAIAELPAILNDFGTLNNYLGDFQRARTST